MTADLFAGFETPPGAGPHQTEGARLAASRDRRPAESKPRLKSQCMTILDRLRQGRTPNTSLAGIALNYRGRVDDLRKAGFDVRCVEQDRKSGLAWYALFTDGKEVSGL
jgi:hypothetical protein